LGGSVIFSGAAFDVVIKGASSDCACGVVFCGVAGIGLDNVCILSQGIGAAAGVAFSSGDIFAAGAAGACIACAIASEEIRSVCREVFWRKYQHWRPSFAWSMR
jgi:hypothetical protein